MPETLYGVYDPSNKLAHVVDSIPGARLAIWHEIPYDIRELVTHSARARRLRVDRELKNGWTICEGSFVPKNPPPHIVNQAMKRKKK